LADQVFDTKGTDVMNNWTLPSIERRLPQARSVVKVGLAGVLLLVTVHATRTAWAQDTTTQGAAQQETQSADRAEADSAKAAEAPAGPPPSRFWIVNTLRVNPALVIFLTLALGYFVGGLKLGHFSLGAVTGTLLVGLLIGQLDIQVSAQVKSVFFTMFLFAVGYSVGPQFVRGVARDGAPQAIFAVLISALCLVTCWLLAKFAGFDVGLAAGFYAGAQTISASIGLATDAINNAGMSNAKEMLNQIPVAYAVCYIWGTVGTGIILAQLGPKLIGVNLPEACKQYEAEMSQGAPEGGMGSAWHQLSMRAFRIEDGAKIVGMNVADAGAAVGAKRVFIERIRRDGMIIDADPEMTLNAGDVVAVSGHTETLVAFEQYAEEVADQELLDVPVESVDLVVTNRAVNGRTLVDLAKADFAQGVYLQKISRGAASTDIPVLAQTRVHRGDILKLAGTKSHVARIEKAIGYADRPSEMTDMVWVGIFIVLAGLLGALSVTIGSVPVTLSVSGGVLIGGLILGWLRSVHPTFGRLPAPTAWFMNSVGLNVFIAIVGISAGPGFIAGLQSSGVGLFLWGIAATSIPMLLAPLIGKYIFKFHPAINLGICGGSRTSTASVAMVGDVAQSNIPMLGYTVPYAVSNTLLTLNGMFIVLIMK
jgi:putative transport protein